MHNAIFLMLVAVLLCNGCSSGRYCDDCKVLNEFGAMPDENGTAVNQWLCKQVENAQHNYGTLYQSDWVGTSDRLSPFGRKRLGNWTRLEGVQPRLYIETSGDQFLDSQRQAAVLGYLSQVGVAISPDSIQGANGDSGLTGEEVPAIADRFLSEQYGQTDNSAGSFGGFPSGQKGGGVF